MSLGDEKYVALTTFTSDGRPKVTPVWIASLGERQLGFTTASSSWKVRRIRHTPAVQLQASDSRGNPRDVQFLAISIVGRIARLVGRGSGTDCAVVITVDG